MCPAPTDFIDRVVIRVKAGDGGDGCISFHREKFVPRGGPDGGDGGAGGNIIFQVHPGRNTLESLTTQPFYRAENGGHGDKRDRSGRSGKDVFLFVPPGTVIREFETQEILVDMEDTDGKAIVAKGGRGGRGNARFATPTRQAPRYAEPGISGEELKLLVELKTVAHIGLVGLPNAGKSTLLAAMTAARPRVAPYPFTTLHPILGTIPLPDGTGLVIADIPGIVQGAHQGVGLGLDFLRHIERTRMIVFVLELSPTDPLLPTITYRQLVTEIRAYDPEILSRPALIALNKLDLLEEGDLDVILEEFLRETDIKRDRIHAISALERRNIPQLRDTLIRLSGTLTQNKAGSDEERFL